MYEQYVDECPEFKDFKTGGPSNSLKTSSLKKCRGFLAKSIRSVSSTATTSKTFLASQMRAELDKFYSAIYNWEEGTKILVWWKVDKLDVLFLTVSTDFRSHCFNSDSYI